MIVLTISKSSVYHSLQVFFPDEIDETSQTSEVFEFFFTTDFFTVKPGRTGVSRPVIGLVPKLFIPATATVYLEPLIRPVILHAVGVVSVDEQVPPPGLAIAVYVMPVPSPSAWTQDTSSALFCVVTTSPATALGGPLGVTDTSADTVPTPTLFVAETAME